jgi:hypothetical protein
MLEVLRTDFARLPRLLGRELQPPPPPPRPVYEPAPVPAAEPETVQLGLF